MAILLITHDLGVVRKMADTVCVMNDGEIVEHAAADQLFGHPSTPIPASFWSPSPRATRSRHRQTPWR